MQDKQRASVECSCSIVKVADMLGLTVHEVHEDKILSACVFSAIHAHADQTIKKWNGDWKSIGACRKPTGIFDELSNRLLSTNRVHILPLNAERFFRENTQRSTKIPSSLLSFWT